MWADMRVWKVGDVGLSRDASLALHSMLKIVHGRSVAHWQLSESAEADVVFVGGEAAVPAWHAADGRGKLLIEVTDGRSTSTTAPFVLRHPFRVMQLLTLLDRVAEHLAAAAPQVADGPWATALAFHDASLCESGVGWRMARTGCGERLWLDEALVRASGQTLREAREGLLRLSAFGPADRPPPEDTITGAKAELGWHLGWHAPAGLPPWLDPECSYGLRRWPDFGRLGATESTLEICAELSVRPQTPAGLGRATGRTAADVSHVLTAASLAGWLVEPARGGVPVRLPASPLRSGWSRLVSQLRKRLT